MTFEHEGVEVELVGVKYADPALGWIHGMGLEAYGQIKFDLCETLEMWRESVGFTE